MTEYCQDPELIRFVPVPVPYTTESARFFIDKLVPAGWESDHEYNWAIRTRTGGFMGMLGARRNGPGSCSFDIGYWLGLAHRGHGYATEAARAAIGWLFETGTATVLTWQTVVGNDESVRVARKLGFRFTGTAPSAGGFRDGARPVCWHGELAESDVRASNAESWRQLKSSR